MKIRFGVPTVAVLAYSIIVMGLLTVEIIQMKPVVVNIYLYTGIYVYIDGHIHTLALKARSQDIAMAVAVCK